MATAYTSNRFAVLTTSAPTKQPQPRAQKDKATVQAQKAQVAQELRAAKTDEPKKQDSDDNKGNYLRFLILFLHNFPGSV